MDKSIVKKGWLIGMFLLPILVLLILKEISQLYILPISSQNSVLHNEIILGGLLTLPFLICIALFYIRILHSQSLKVKILFASTLFITLLALEVLLRSLGFIPGQTHGFHDFRKTEAFICYDFFKADNEGITTMRPDLMQDCISSNTQRQPHFLARNCSFLNSPAKKDVFLLYTKNAGSELSASIADYLEKSIQPNGFRSIPFKPISAQKPSVLLLGDSFTWGSNATHARHSFADMLLKAGYPVFNTGIIGADPAQYVAIAEKYMPSLKPDIAVVNIYAGNDWLHYHRVLKPHKPVMYVTNAGILPSFQHGTYALNPQEAYQTAAMEYCIPNHENIFNAWLSKTVLGTLLWRFCFRVLYIDVLNQGLYRHYVDAAKKKQKQSTTWKALEGILKVADLHHTKVLFTLIPVFKALDAPIPDNHPLKQQIRVFPALLSDYDPLDGHFNDQGHANYAAWLEKEITNFYLQP